LTQVKLEHADEYKKKIFSLCLTQCKSPDSDNLARIGAYLGDFANNLRSPLNYTMRRFVESKLKPVLSVGEYGKIQQHQDFPWADSKTKFDRKELTRYICRHSSSVYRLIEGVQPYHHGNEWLKQLMLISNRDKHVVENEVRTLKTGAMFVLDSDGTPHPKPLIVGDKLLIVAGTKPHSYSLPCYYYPYGMFAMIGGKWMIFWIIIDGAKLGLTRFLENSPQKVKDLIHDLEAHV
jgi:hypothetical protein